MLLGVMIGSATFLLLLLVTAWGGRRRRRRDPVRGLVRYGRALGAMADAEVRAKSERVVNRPEVRVGQPSVLVEGDARPRPKGPSS